MPTNRTGLLRVLCGTNRPSIGAIIRDMTSVPDRARVRLTGISSRAYEHPADRSALVALRKLSGFDTLLRRLFGLFNERAFRLTYLASAVRVSERQFPHIHELVRDGSYILDLPEVPECYVVQDPTGERDGARPGQAVHRDHHRHGQPVRPGRAALGRGARAGPHPVRARGVPHHAADPAPVGDAGRVPADRPRPHGHHLGPGGVVPQVRAVLRPGRAAGRAGLGRGAARR